MPIPLIASAISAIASIGGSAIASHQAGKAVDAQVASGDKALKVLDQQNTRAQSAIDRAYSDQRANLNPYQQIGTGALGSLQRRLGINAGSQAQPMMRQPNGGSLAALAGPQQAPAGRVQMRAPDGSTGYVPVSQVAKAQAQGLVPING